MRSSCFALLLILVLAGGCARRADAPLEWVKPRALQPGDTIAFVAPARTRPIEAIDATERILVERGYKVVRYPQITSKYGYLAGSDEERAEALMDAFLDPEIDAIFPLTGGYGVTRLLDRLDFDAIRAHPKVVIGYSDITGLHLALQRRAGLMSFHSPFPGWFLTAAEPNPYAEEHFWRAIEANRYPAGEQGWEIETSGRERAVETLVPGVARGRLTGGNLSLIAALMGTPYEIDTRGALLFIEDVREAPYRIDRMLSTLALAGKLAEVNGVILGVFHRCEPEDPEDSLSLDQVLADYFAELGVPVVKNFPVGHVRDNATLPVGAMAELDATAGTLRVLENPVVFAPR
ncbi:MAG: LD-carboxypeptidase [Candidatus Sumerlaeia bacterium]|nr:LD-carboxypeptidase [Candidatus Sumerlaeia bacterium]